MEEAKMDETEARNSMKRLINRTADGTTKSAFFSRFEGNSRERSTTPSNQRSTGRPFTPSIILENIIPWLEPELSLKPYEEASMLIVYAREGHELHPDTSLTTRSRDCYRLRHKYQWIFRLAAWAMLVLQVFERPLWTFRVTSGDWKNGEDYPSYQIPYLPELASILLTSPCLLVLWAGVGLEVGYKRCTASGYITNIFGTILLFRTLSILIDLISFAAGDNFYYSGGVFEPFCIILVEPSFDSHIGYLMRTVPKFVTLMSVLALFVCIYAALGYLIFSPDSEEAKQYFHFYGSSVWDMLMVLNGSNWPSPMIPAYENNRLYFIYFGVYIMLGSWLILNLILGFVYLFYRVEQRDIALKQVVTKAAHLVRAFRILDVEEKGFLNYVQVDQLLEEMYTHFQETAHPPTPQERYELIILLDIQSNKIIDEKDFQYIETKCFSNSLRTLRANKTKFIRYLRVAYAQNKYQGQNTTAKKKRSISGVSTGTNTNNPLQASLLNDSEDQSKRASSEATQSMDNQDSSRLDFAQAVALAKLYGKIEDPRLLELYQQLEASRLVSEEQPDWKEDLLRYVMFVDSIYFDITMDTLICLFGIVFLSGIDGFVLYFTYLSFAVLEFVSKFIVKGRHRYYRSYRNFVDGSLTFLLVLIAVLRLGRGEGNNFYGDFAARALVLARTLIYPRNLLVTKGFSEFRKRHRLAFKYAFKGAGHFRFLLLITFALLFFFASAGMLIFGGTIQKTGEQGEDIYASAYGDNGYWPLNFNDLPSGMVTLFILLHVNNMHIVASGLVAGSNQWAELFFALWYSLGVLLLLNILTAVFLNQSTGYLEKLATEHRREAEEAAKRNSFVTESSGLAKNDSSGSLNRDSTIKATRIWTQFSLKNIFQSKQEKRDSQTQEVPEGYLGLPFVVDKQVTRSSTAARSSGAGARRKRQSKTERRTTSRGSLANAASKLMRFFSVKDESDSDEDDPLKRKTVSKRPTLKSSDTVPSSLGRRTTSAEIGQVTVEEPTLGGQQTAFTQSIFASQSNRARLEQWVQSHYPKPSSTPKAASGRSRSADKFDVSQTPIPEETKSSVSFSYSSAGTPGGSHQPITDLLGAASPTRASEGTPAGKKVRPRARTSAANRDSEGSVSRGSAFHRNTTGSMRDSIRESVRVEIRTPRPEGADYSSDEDEEKLPIVLQLEVPVAGVEDLMSQGEQSGTNGSLEMESVEVDSDGRKSGQSRKGSFISATGSLFSPKGSTRVGRKRGASRSVLELMNSTNSSISSHEKAAVLLQFARDGEEHSMLSTERALAFFRLRTRLSPLFRLFAVLNVLLRFFQRPLWTYYYDRWDDNSVYPMSGIPLLSHRYIIAIKVPILMVLLGGLLLEVGYKESDFMSLVKNITVMRALRLFLVLFCASKLLMLFAAAAGAENGPQLVTITAAGNILYLLWFNRRSLHKFRIVLQVVPSLTVLLFVLFLVVLLFAGFGPYIFRLENSQEDADDDQLEEYFGTFSSSVWSVFVAITSSSFPNQVMPAYRDYREVFFYFFLFICIGAFGLLNLVIVIVLVEFQKASQLAADIQNASRKVLTLRAFELLDVEGVGYVSREQVKLLLDELFLNYSDFRKAGIPDEAARNLLINILDVDGDGVISVNDFLFFLDVTRIKIRVDSPLTFLETWAPSVFYSARFQRFRNLVLSPWYDLSLDTVSASLILASLIVNHDQLYYVTDSSLSLMACTQVVFLWEFISKFLVRGWQRYWQIFRNRIDFICTALIMVCIFIDSSFKNPYDVGFFTITARILMMLRLLLFPRNLRFLFRNTGLKKLARLMRRIFAKIWTLGIVFLCVGYVFTSIGVFIYGGLINKSSVSNPYYSDLQTSQYGENDFWSLNFNDFMSGCVTLFSCLHVSDFDVITSGFTSTTSEYSRLYFTAWYVVGVLLMLNIIKSFFLGEFLSLFVNPNTNVMSSGSKNEQFRTSFIYQQYIKQELSEKQQKNILIRNELIDDAESSVKKPTEESPTTALNEETKEGGLDSNKADILVQQLGPAAQKSLLLEAAKKSPSMADSVSSKQLLKDIEGKPEKTPKPETAHQTWKELRKQSSAWAPRSALLGDKLPTDEGSGVAEERTRRKIPSSSRLSALAESRGVSFAPEDEMDQGPDGVDNVSNELSGRDTFFLQPQDTSNTGKSLTEINEALIDGDAKSRLYSPPKYRASTAKVKYSDGMEREALRKRLKEMQGKYNV